MPHAALWVVQQVLLCRQLWNLHCFNAARGFVGGAAGQTQPAQWHPEVSMPHAALWVVQRSPENGKEYPFHCFNAARGFVGGAAINHPLFVFAKASFNAARGFVGGAASSLAVLFPLGRKSPFGKSPEI